MPTRIRTTLARHPEHGHGTQVVVGEGDRELVIDVDADGVLVGIDIHSFASEIVDITKLEAEGPIFGLVRAERRAV
ncbi:MAG: hypothetical protein LC781_09905 [Actinobacteria bacterium]|nr:hypothetical protein [Actinomycetota bacterium]